MEQQHQTFSDFSNDKEKKLPIRLDFPRLRDIIKESDFAQENTFFDNNFAIVRFMRSIFFPLLGNNQPYRLEEARIGHIKKGKAIVSINLIDHEVHENMLLFLSENTIIQPVSASADFDLEGLGVTNDFFKLMMNNQPPSFLSSGISELLIDISDYKEDLFGHIFELIWKAIHQKDYNRELTYSLICALFYDLDKIYKNYKTIPQKPSSREQEIFDKFIVLVNKHCKSEHALSFYADKLCITQRYLGTLVYKASEKTAKDWIERAIITEAKILLKHTNKLTYQIADELNFPNPSFFCKYFKRLTGMTPLEYQKT